MNGRERREAIERALRVKLGRVRLARWPTTATPGCADRGEAERRLAKHLERIEMLGTRLHAEGRRSLLVVLQGMDTSGKDGVIRHVMSAFNALSCRAEAFGVPTEKESAHDFLWRIHAATPGAGQVVVFNRSHYEDVLVVRVRGLVPRAEWSKRYEAIRGFERTLADGGTTILKFYLHISRGEQRARLVQRLDDPEKRWKFREGDLDDRAHWSAYRRAYEDALGRCSAPHAPWYVIPADRKWYRDLAIAEIVLGTLERMNPRPPRVKLDVARLRKRLVAG